MCGRRVDRAVLSCIVTALDDITVLDLTHALAGPFASTMLGDYGAEIIKIEPPGHGDIARAWGPPFYHNESAYFVGLNRNKRSIEVDLKHPQGQELFFRLLERADVVLENFRVGTVEKLGIDYARARARHPGVIYCSISGFGQDGPYRDRAALDLVVQAESGLISVTGEPGRPGVRCGISIA
ncbi:MAG: formyl-CoA transferase, partial [Acidobacteria bacterium]